jgi:CubicO group peptidase (beta-lactamase class C family)
LVVHTAAITTGAQLDAVLRQHHFTGYVLLERQGKILLSKGYGMADKQTKLPNTIRSRWLDAGVNRFMTAIAILRLQDRHKLSVQDRICRYVSSCPRDWQAITIHHLLLDTSGLANLDTPAESGSMAQAMAKCKRLPPEGPPGTISPESRCNMLLLDAVLMKQTGMSWTGAMQTLVFGPAHMTDSGRLTNAMRPPQRVQGYSGGQPTNFGNFNNYPAPYSSIADLERMDRALLAGRLLSAAARRALFTPRIHGSTLVDRYNGNSYGAALDGGYECFLRKATATSVLVVDKPGGGGGLALDNALSPRTGTIAIVAVNEETSPQPTDVIFGLGSTLLWRK